MTVMYNQFIKGGILSYMDKQEIGKEKKKGLGNVLKLLRIAREMNTKELATKMEVSSTYISEVEANNKTPSLEMLAKYSEALGVSKSTIIYFDEEGEKNGYHYQELLLEILKKIVEPDKK